MNRLFRLLVAAVVALCVLPLAVLVFSGGTPSGATSLQVQAQSLADTDLSRLRAEDVTDEQLRMFAERARAEGITESQALQLAIQRGMSASVAGQLRERLRELERMQPEARDTTDSRLRFEDELLDTLGHFQPEELDTIAEVDPVLERTFGSSVFRQGGISFEPSRFIATPENYIVGPGDELIVDIWGQASALYRQEVSPEGSISIDNLAPIYVHGLSVEQARERIVQRLMNIYAGLRPGEQQNTYARVTLGGLRSIQVTMAGEVSEPGDYTLSSLSTVYNALSRAGGPGPNGSFREIRLIRENREVVRLDLYDFLVHGDQTNNIRLHDGDVVLVPPFSSRVTVAGEIKREGLYHMKAGETLADLIDYAGDFSDRAYTRRLNVYRTTPTERAIESVSYDRFGQFALQNGDSIFVDTILDRFQNRVVIQGAVWREGEYQLTEGLTVSQLIDKADGLRPDAFLSRGIINRLKPDLSFELLSFDVGEMVNGQASVDIALKPEDQVHIQSVHNMREEFTVAISGAVRTDTLLQWRENMTLEDLIFKANGFSEAASEARIEVARRIMGEPAPLQRSSLLAEIFVFGVSRDLRLSERDGAFSLQPFDEVFVRERPDYRIQRTVSVEGEVLFPGTYTLESHNERISDLLSRTGGLTSEAYVPGATLIRRTQQREEVMDFAFLTQEANDTDESDEQDEDEKQEMVVRPSESRVGIDLQAILNNPGSAEDLFLREGDVLRIPDAMQTVRISGAVMQEVEVRYRSGQRLNYYINRAGGYSMSARSKQAYVLYANGDLDRRRNYVFGLVSRYPQIEPGSEIIIPERVEREQLSTGEVIAISAAVVSMATSLTIAIDRLLR